MSKSTHGSTGFAPTMTLRWGQMHPIYWIGRSPDFEPRLARKHFLWREADTDVPALKIFNTEPKSGLQFLGKALIESTKIQMQAKKLIGD